MKNKDFEKQITFIRFLIYQDILNKTNEEVNDYNLSNVIKCIVKMYINSNARIYNIDLLHFVTKCHYAPLMGSISLINYPVAYYNFYDEVLKKCIIKFKDYLSVSEEGE